MSCTPLEDDGIYVQAIFNWETCVFQPQTNAPTGNPTALCPGWCVSNNKDWSAKCTWRACETCQQCVDLTLSPTSNPTGVEVTTSPTKDPTKVPTTQQITPECPGWCENSAALWSAKCNWPDCSSCGTCATLTASPTQEPTDQGVVANCAPWCLTSPAEWNVKCGFGACNGCTQCDVCQPWCGNAAAHWSTKCLWSTCLGCSQCPWTGPKCMGWCSDAVRVPWTTKCNWINCEDCDQCHD